MKKLTLLAASVAAILTGCGGSDSGSSVNSSSDGSVITAMDGYYQNAVVFDDVDNDGVLDISGDTIFGLTDAQGKITLPAASEIRGRLALQVIAPSGTAQNQLVSYDATTYAGVYTIDTDYPGTALQELVLRTSANADGDTVISPITDLVATLEDSGDADAEQTVATKLGINIADIHRDYINNNQIHKVAQILAASKTHNSSNYQAAAVQVVDQAVTQVNDMDEADVSNINNVPVMIISGDESNGYLATAVTNSKATVNSTEKAALDSELAGLNAVEDGTISFTYDVAALFNDSDLNSTPVISLSYTKESESGVAIILSGTTLTISSSHILSGDDIEFTLSISDTASDATSVGSVAASFKISVEALNNAPTADSQVQADIQDTLDNWLITQGDVFSDSFSLSGLFSDQDGDSLTYSATTDATGLTIGSVSNDTVVISGTPTIMGTGYSVSITASDGKDELVIELELPEIFEGTSSESSNSSASGNIDDLIGKTWFELDYGEDDGDESTTDFTRIWCNTMRFEDGIVYGNQRAIGNLSACDASVDQQYYGGTYIVTNNTIVASYSVEGEEFDITYSLKEEQTPGTSISSGALTVLTDYGETFTFFASQTDAEARIKMQSDDGYESRNFKMWLPGSVDGEFQLGSVDISMDSSEYGETDNNGDADIFFNPASGGSISCTDINRFYGTFIMMSSAMDTNTDADMMNSWEYGHGIRTSECYDHTDESDPYAAIDFDFDVSNLEVGAIYSIIGYTYDEQGNYVETLKFNIEWTGAGNND